MIKKNDKIKKSLSQSIQEAIADTFGHKELTSEAIYDLIGFAPNLQMGHLAFPCFPLAKALKMGPPQISQKLAEAFSNDKFANEFTREVKAVGPYLNFFIDEKTVGEKILQDILNGEFFKLELTENSPKTMIEYSQPNTHKELHVGHMRNLCLGNALIKLHRYTGHEIVSATFPGDVGTHVAKCLWFLKFHNKEEIPQLRKGAWLGRIYTLANNKLEDEKGSDKEDDNRKHLTDILKELESKKGEFYDLWKETREWSIEMLNEVYQWADVEFDQWYWESEVDSSSVKLVMEHYKKGLFKKDKGAIGIDLSEDKLGFCLLIKSDGNGLYATKDIELARRKFEDHKIEKNVYVVDKRQALHFQQVFKVLEKMGMENAKNCFHLAYDFVELPDGAMSSRKGNVIPLQGLIDQMEETIKNEHLKKYKDEWSQEKIDEVSTIVAKGAIYYGMIRMDNNKKIVFDMKEWLKLDGESGPYIQYVHARIASMCDKLEYNPRTKVDWSQLKHKNESALILKLIDFNNIALSSCLNYKTSTLCAYLYDLSKLFNSFYAECSVGKADTKELMLARLALSKSVATVLSQGLKLLGITAPERM